MSRTPVLLSLLFAAVVPAVETGCSRSSSGRTAGLHLVYAVDWPAGKEAPEARDAQQLRSNALQGLYRTVLSRLALAGFVEARGSISDRDNRLVVQVPDAKGEDSDRIKEIVAAPPTLEHRLASTEPYVDEAFRAFLAADPGRADGLLVVTDGPNTYVMARAKTPEEERTLLGGVLRTWRETPEVRGDAARAALWARVRIGQSKEPRDVAVRPEAPETRWRTFLVEPENLLSGGDVAKAETKIDPNGIRDQVWVVVDYSREGAKRLAEMTGQNVGRSLVVIVDGIIVFSGQIVEPIARGSLKISFGAGRSEDLYQRANDLVCAISACTSGVRLRQPPLEEQWTAP